MIETLWYFSVPFFSCCLRPFFPTGSTSWRRREISLKKSFRCVGEFLLSYRLFTPVTVTVNICIFLNFANIFMFFDDAKCGECYSANWWIELNFKGSGIFVVCEWKALFIRKETRVGFVFGYFPEIFWKLFQRDWNHLPIKIFFPSLNISSIQS